MACPRVACTVNYWICKKQHNCRHWSPQVLPALHPLQNYTGGWGKVNQYNAESCCLYFACQTANKHKWFFNDRPLYPTKLSIHKRLYTHTTHSLPHTSIMSFIKGSTFGLMDHCKCHSHSHIVFEFQQDASFSPVLPIFLRYNMWCRNTPNLSQVQENKSQLTKETTETAASIL